MLLVKLLVGTKKMGWYYILEATNVLKLGKEGMEYIIKDTKILPGKIELASVLKHRSTIIVFTMKYKVQESLTEKKVLVKKT